MAHKPGKVDLRCPEAVQSAFLLHSKYSKMQEAIETGLHMVQKGDWAFAQYLSPSNAKRALDPCLPEIVRKQQRSGMWFRKNAEVYSYGILKGLKQADLLPELINGKVLRHDPYQCFANAQDEWGFLVRRNIMKEPVDTDRTLQAKLISAYTSTQRKDGSWGHTVSETALIMEKLLELGMPPKDIYIKRGTEWLLAQFQESITRKRPNSSLEIIVQSLFSTDDCGAESAAVSRILNHNTIAASCFVSIPIIQTALALRILVRLGFENNKKVNSAFSSLLDMQTTQEKTQKALAAPLGGWCAHQCRFKLEERAKAIRRIK
jgi:hypothetical protein